MIGILAVFRSRMQTMEFVSKLNANGIYATSVTTPREANVGCGISARFASYDARRAKQLLQTCNRSSFVGFFSVETGIGRVFVRPISI